LSASDSSRLPDFGSEGSDYLTVCCRTVELTDKLFGGESLVHIEGKYTAIFTADITRQALQLSTVIIPDRRVESYEGCYVVDERCDTVRIEEVGSRGLW